ncbi:hypothetical protein B0H16DRAFT_1688154 [Mycena metata]|uniref:F-box domain-containing protein n=1 Tax=Mycena metata TaxID=1033252 RepID=A0AAD7JH73_9AGAR|nr:hypothetical protein B0H16DRAFT_1688154 [Mycena metata]
MKPKNITLRRRLAYVVSQLEDESLPSRHSPRLNEERQRRLMEEKVTIQRSLDSMVYPILTLPVEIMTEIFLHCLPNHPLYPRKAVAPMLLGRICRQWRNIACSTPRLWAQLVVSSRRGPSFELLLREWLRRARATPLSLHLWLPHSCSEHSSSLLATFPFTGHWAQMTSFHGSCFTPAECLDLLVRAPQLTHCEFNIDAVSTLPSPFQSTSKLLLARLQHLELTSLLLLVLDSLTTPALHSLKITGRLQPVAATVLHSFLERAPKLHTFDASSYDPRGIARDGILCNVLRAIPLLTSFRLAMHSTASFFELLRLLNESPAFLPRIQNITFLSFSRVDWTETNINTFIDTVISRWEATSTATQLLEFKLLMDPFYDQILDDRISACVSKLEEQGMRIYVGHPKTLY